MSGRTLVNPHSFFWRNLMWKMGLWNMANQSNPSSPSLPTLCCILSPTYSLYCGEPMSDTLVALVDNSSRLPSLVRTYAITTTTTTIPPSGSYYVRSNTTWPYRRVQLNIERTCCTYKEVSCANNIVAMYQRGDMAMCVSKEREKGNMLSSWKGNGKRIRNVLTLE